MSEMISKENWNKFVLKNQGSFLQSFEWGEFQENFGRRVFRFQFGGPPSSAGADFGVAMQFIEYKLPFGKKYWYAPRGPVASSKLKVESEKLKLEVKSLIEKIKEEAGKDVMFFRIGPEWPLDCHSGLDPESMTSGSRIKCVMTDLLREAGFKKLNYDIEPSQTLILDISKNEEELLAQMHEKWRYNIRLAERKNVKVKIISAADADFEKYFKEFYCLVAEGTAARHQIKHHPKDYYKKQLEIGKNPPQPSFLKEGGSSLYKREVGRDFLSILFIAEYENKVIAANIVVLFGQTATYLHGATDNEYRNLMAPHLLQWEQIKFAKARGCAQYDFFGIANEHTLDKRGPSWEGFTRFKKGFSGQEVNYIGYFDWPLNGFWYFIYRLVQRFRR